MGQGIHTKVAMIAAQALDIPIESIHIVETTTDKASLLLMTSASCTPRSICSSRGTAGSLGCTGSPQ